MAGTSELVVKRTGAHPKTMQRSLHRRRIVSRTVTVMEEKL
jgi:hypothetical protein